MKTTASAVVLITGLVSRAAADALQPQDVPVECATICGPMVDLSSKCTPITPKGAQVGHSTDRTATGAVNVAVWVEARGADVEEQSVRRFQYDADMHKRFLTIVPAPTSFDAKYSSILNPGDDPSSQPSGVTPMKTTSLTIEDISDTSTPLPSSLPRPEPDPEPTKSSLLSAPSPPQPTEAQTSSASGEQVNSSDQHPPTPSPGTPKSRTAEKPASTMTPVANTSASMNAEEQCVCFNKSFNVQRVAALCASCIVQQGSQDTNMQAIMSVCNFAEQNYTPADNSIVDNIRVSATRPTTALGHKAGVSNAGHGVTRGRIREPSMAVLCVLTSVLLSAM